MDFLIAVTGDGLDCERTDFLPVDVSGHRLGLTLNVWNLHHLVVSDRLQTLLQAASLRKITVSEQEEQRRSFAYGNTHFENLLITPETIDRAAEALKNDSPNGHSERQ